LAVYLHGCLLAYQYRQTHTAFQQLNAWFNTNLLSLNYNKTQFIQFRSTNNQTQLDISYNNRYIPNDTNTRYSGITIHSFIHLL
jgi:hypothetical protein